ncbi:MAG: AlpA family phage regulatory protein [Alphaproteobacteria bacterium]|nr:AlpA family phage regulatory protein [Alphaproteobacteria bacterium]
MDTADRIIRIRTVIERTSLSRSTIYRQMKNETFPQQVRISVTGAGWRESDVNKWIKDPAHWRRDKTVEHSPNKVADKKSRCGAGQLTFQEFDKNKTLG